MRNCNHLKVFIFILLMISYLWIGEAYASPDTDSSKMVENINQGSIILFSQNYSEINNLPANVFIAKVQREKAYDKLYSSIYATQESELFFNNTSTGLKYNNVRDFPLIPCSLLPGMDTISCFGINEYLEHFRSTLDIFTFCECTSVPIIHYLEEPRQAGALYICNLTPMVKCAYEISMDINADDSQSFVELDSPGSRLIIRESEGQTILKSYYRDSSGETKYEKVILGDASEKTNFKIIFDGYNKTNTIYVQDGNSIVTPFYNLDRQKLPYIDFSSGYIKFTAFILGEGTYLDVDIYDINQTTERKLVTAIGNSKMIPFGLDGPLPMNTTGEGIDYLNSKGYRGTMWFDKGMFEKSNDTYVEYLRSLVVNDSWEVGIHYTKELNSLPLEEAYRVMDEEYLYVSEKVGQKPTSWCCLRNRDNLTHAIYAYENLGMTWRNGDAAIHAERDVGNLYDDTWEWWEPASRAGMSYPVFSHQLDVEPAIKYSISRSKFQNWVDNYESNNMTVVSFYEYNQISRNTYDASFENLQYNEKLVAFDAHTNGASALVNVNITAGNDTQVYDTTLEKSLDYETEQDKSITFRVEDNHTYKIDINSVE
ncbi:hypothetical protein EO98_17225 [Methanosarcina sp. 2.H.T.1A.6]|nr:hypothetical protein EO97_00575 [Methanosarcina sp. 2.H.T.1A.15]KKG15091.1 hypothetical protein EO94_04280 [Methanosarcina sp. 2.H.T.1A.3]KKG20790.1 hypothetical protein EO96_18270 [Methanosarcina sp. 2.H.T.1A.8]KKG22107.1 hypothetical protein EO98_17225 [Methanosarcina sp. 2.H.T.1A.6]